MIDGPGCLHHSAHMGATRMKKGRIAMRIAKNIEMLEVKAQMTYYPVLLWDGVDMVLFDTGYPGQFEEISKEIARCGFKPEQVTKVLLTHQDIDHIGSAKIFREMGAEIMAHIEEAPYIQGDRPLTKIADAETHVDKFTPDMLAFYENLKVSAKDAYVHVDSLLSDGQTINVCGGIKAIHTPGHTPGHVAFMLCDSGIIVCGDAANIDDGRLIGSNPMYTHDTAAAERSLKKILSFDATGYVCYHSGYLEN